MASRAGVRALSRLRLLRAGVCLGRASGEEPSAPNSDLGCCWACWRVWRSCSQGLLAMDSASKRRGRGCRRMLSLKLHKADILDMMRPGAGGVMSVVLFCYLIQAVRRPGQEKGGMEEKGRGQSYCQGKDVAKDACERGPDPLPPRDTEEEARLWEGPAFPKRRLLTGYLGSQWTWRGNTGSNKRSLQVTVTDQGITGCTARRQSHPS